jgi:hypothetical protein
MSTRQNAGKTRKGTRPRRGGPSSRAGKETGLLREQAQEVRRLVFASAPLVIEGGIETKYRILDSAYAAVTSAATIVRLTPITQGVSGVQRVGDEVEITGIVVRLAAYLSAGTTSVLRVIVFQWGLDDALLVPAVANILLAPGVAASTPLAPYNPAAIDATPFRVLWDELLTLVNTGPPQVRKLENTSLRTGIHFEAGATNGRGHLYILLVSDSAVNTPQVGYQSITYFTDA